MDQLQQNILERPKAFTLNQPITNWRSFPGFVCETSLDWHLICLGYFPPMQQSQPSPKGKPFQWRIYNLIMILQSHL